MAYDDLTEDQLVAEVGAWANKAENALQGVMRRVAEIERRKSGEAPKPIVETEPAPSFSQVRVARLGQSHSTNYGDYWFGKMVRENPQIDWVLPEDEDGKEIFNRSGRSLSFFQDNLSQLIALKPDHVIVSMIPGSVQRQGANEWRSLFSAIKEAGASIITHEPWSRETLTSAGTYPLEVDLLRQMHADGVIDVLAPISDDPIMAAPYAYLNGALFKDDGVHLSEIHNVGGHAFVYALIAKAIRAGLPSLELTNVPYPQVTDAHRQSLAPIAAR